MSKLIKSAGVSLENTIYKVKPNVTISTSDYYGSGKPLSTFEVIGSAKSEADLIIAQAQRAASDIREASEDAVVKMEADALEKANQIYENARATGYDDGYQAGFSAGSNEAASIIQDAIEIKEKTKQDRDIFISSSKSELVKLSLDIAEKIINREIDDENYLVHLVELGLSKLVVTNNVTIRVSSEDYELANYIKPRIYAMLDKVDSLEIKEDLSMNRGDLVIESGFGGSIDVSVQSQLQKLKDEFEKYLSET